MKQLLWLGDSYRVLTELPRNVKQVVGFQLHLIQLGQNPDDWKPMPRIGPGVREIRIHVEGEYRVIYLTNFDEGVYVLHTFGKKTQKTPKNDLDIARTRFCKLIRNRKS